MGLFVRYAQGSRVGNWSYLCRIVCGCLESTAVDSSRSYPACDRGEASSRRRATSCEVWNWIEEEQCSSDLQTSFPGFARETSWMIISESRLDWVSWVSKGFIEYQVQSDILVSFYAAESKNTRVLFQVSWLMIWKGIVEHELEHSGWAFHLHSIELSFVWLSVDDRRVLVVDPRRVSISAVGMELKHLEGWNSLWYYCWVPFVSQWR